VGFLAKLTWFLIGLLVFCFAVLAVNQDSAALRFLVWRTPEISLFWWLLLAFVSGLVVGGASVGLVSIKHRLNERSLARQLASSQQELVRLKTPGA
jgi:uncharacterized integral membrane protein